MSFHVFPYVISSEARNLAPNEKISQSPASHPRSRQGSFEMTGWALRLAFVPGEGALKMTEHARGGESGSPEYVRIG